MADKELLEFPGGANRESSPPYYREVPHGFLKRLADALKRGAIKYNESPLDSNWKKGDINFALGCFDHAIEHLYAWRNGRTDEDHLGHAAANLAFLAHFQETGVWEPTDAMKQEPEDPLERLEGNRVVVVPREIPQGFSIKDLIKRAVG